MKTRIAVLLILIGATAWADAPYVVGGFKFGADGGHEALVRTGKDVRMMGLGEVTSLAAVGKDLYAAGSFQNGGAEYACLWKNGVRADLSGGLSSSAGVVCVAGGRVYVSGQYMMEGRKTACYWKDGVRTDLSADLAYAWTYDLAVSGKDVFVSGGFKSGEKAHACVWKNGVRTDLGEGNIAFGITVHNGDYVIAGSLAGTKPCLFTPAGAAALEVPASAGAWARDVAFMGDSRVVLISHPDPRDRTRQAGYLRDGKWKPLVYKEVESGLKYQVSSVGSKTAVIDGHVLITGTATADTGEGGIFLVSCVWRDGEVDSHEGSVDAWQVYNCIAPLSGK